MGLLIYHVLLWSGMRGEKGRTWGQECNYRAFLYTHLSYGLPFVCICFGFGIASFESFPSKSCTATDNKRLKQCELGRHLTRLFHKKGKGVQAKQVVSGGGRRGAKRRHRKQRHSSVRFPQGRPFTAEWQWHDLPGSKKALQQTFQQRFGVWQHNRMLF